MVKRSKESIESNINEKLLASCIQEHLKDKPRLDKLDRYYCGKHDILNRQGKGTWAPNNRMVCNYPKYITDTACGYVFGNPVAYKSDIETDAEILKAVLSYAVTHDSEMGKDLSVFGVGYELLYMSGDDTPVPRLALLDPREAFVVYDDTVENNPLFGVRIVKQSDKKDGYTVHVYTANETLRFTMESMDAAPSLAGSEAHFFGRVPLVQYWNNEEGMGDFEGVMTLVDAYNVLMSDRVNDKERFVDAILLLSGAQFPDDEEEAQKAAARMLMNRILELPPDAKAEYITKQLSESETQVLAEAIVREIHKLSQVPDFTDEHFSGNTSGVAIKYKLLSLENLAKVKERFFIAGLRERLRLLSQVLYVQGKANMDPDAINIRMNRTLPANELELAQIVNMLNGIVSSETILTMLPMVEDVDKELVRVQKQAKEKAKAQIEAFSRAGDPASVRA